MVSLLLERGAIVDAATSTGDRDAVASTSANIHYCGVIKIIITPLPDLKSYFYEITHS
jgi:hypothetical protein